jgi:hypothetical protein
MGKAILKRDGFFSFNAIIYSFLKGIIMSKTTICRGNVLAHTIVQTTFPSTTFSTTTTEVNIAVGGVKATDNVQAQIDATMTVGVGIGNVYTNTDNQITVRLINLTGGSVTQAAATMLVSIKSCEDSPIPSSVV